jgi:glycosyltransferase involved in cell wall biosynthesis
LGGSGHNRLLKIIHIDPERNWGGGEAQVFGLLTHLAAKGHQNVLLGHPEGRIYEAVKKLNIKTRPLIVRNDFDPLAALRLSRIIREERCDLIHLHTKRAHALALWLRRRETTPKIVVTRRMDYPVAKGWYTNQLYNSKVDGVIAISRSIVSILSEGGVDSKKITLIHSGVDARRFERVAVRVKTDSDSAVVGMAGIMEERKGHRSLLEAARLLKDRGQRIRYLLAGDGSLKPELQTRAATLGLKDQVSFPGFISNIAEFLGAIDLFVMPSLFEGLSVAVLEAMAAGKPVVATNVGGLAESGIDSITGFLVPPQDPRALADAIEKLIAEKSLARRMGARGAERVREHFTLEKMAEKNEAYYFTLIHEDR